MAVPSGGVSCSISSLSAAMAPGEQLSRRLGATFHALADLLEAQLFELAQQDDLTVLGLEALERVSKSVGLSLHRDSRDFRTDLGRNRLELGSIAQSDLLPTVALQSSLEACIACDLVLGDGSHPRHESAGAGAFELVDIAEGANERRLEDVSRLDVRLVDVGPFESG